MSFKAKQMENTILYFQEPIKSWQRQLIPNLSSKDELIVLDEDEKQIKVHHEQSGYKGWVMKHHLSDAPGVGKTIEVKKIDWVD